MAGVARKFPGLTFVVAAIRELPAELYAPVTGLPNVHFCYDKTYDLLAVSHVAVVTSGTATLETGLFRVPQVVVYKATAVEYAIGSRVVKVDFISLVNLIAGRPVIAEFLQSAATVENVAKELSQLIEDGPHRLSVLSGYDEVYRKLDTGSASENTAALMVKYLGEPRSNN
ncbi:MAG: lipid-A-disaccharide synthase, partial [Bacteroidota bacterium]